jgi:peroxiredoxin
MAHSQRGVALRTGRGNAFGREAVEGKRLRYLFDRPVVSTSIGIKGFDAVGGVRALIADVSLRDRLSERDFQLVRESYSLHSTIRVVAPGGRKSISPGESHAVSQDIRRTPACPSVPGMRPGGQQVRQREGLPPGSFLSDFALPDLTGRIVRVSDLTGLPYILLFVGARCEHSARVLRHLGQLPAVADMPRVIVVAPQGPQIAQSIAQQFQLSQQVVVQEEHELSSFMRVPATPAAYAVSEQRTTVGPLAIGAAEVMAMLPAVMSPFDVEQTGTRELQATAVPIPRTMGGRGLPAGVAAPDIDLHAAGGDRSSIFDTQGRWTLLVFWSPACPPCSEVADALAAAAAPLSGVDLVIVSRGDEADRSELEALFGPEVSILMQDRRSIAAEYRMYDSPAAYLIDPAGRTAAPVAVGAQAVRQLAQNALERAVTTLA